MRRALSCAAAGLLLPACVGAQAAHTPPPREHLLFVDISGSIAEEQHALWKAMILERLRSCLTPGDRVALFLVTDHSSVSAPLVSRARRPAPLRICAWCGFGVAEYRLEVVALNPLRTIHAASHGTSLQATVSTLPTDGSPLRVRLKSRIGSVWLVNVYSFTAARP